MDFKDFDLDLQINKDDNATPDSVTSAITSMVASGITSSIFQGCSTDCIISGGTKRTQGNVCKPPPTGGPHTRNANC